jgi:hypothetical protein
MRTLLAISALLVPVALVACGSSTNSGGGGTGTGGNTATTTTSDTSTGGSTGTTTTTTTESTTSSSTVDCLTGCIAAHQAGAQEFQGFVFQECAGCGQDAGTAPCAAQCNAATDCTGSPSAACQQCIGAEEAKALGSTCISKVFTADCKSTDCSAFATCAAGCSI